LNLGAQDVHSTTVRNSILWGNTGPSGSHVQVSSWGDIQAEIAWSTLQGGIGGWAGPVTVGPGLLAANPAFVHPPFDLHLGPGSPCIDAGEPAFAPLPGELDLDGEPRVFGPVVDQGADEDQP
jgi:hypothetical protein